MADNKGATQSAATPYHWYVVGVLTLVHVIGHVDRHVMSVLVTPLKAEFGLSDTLMGLMTGAAFALFYAALGFPLALWADRRNRRNLIAVAISLWSAMTVLCGMAASAVQLILARIGVAVGEAGSNPASQSIIADMFPAARRATPMAILAIGPNLGIMIGFAVGGILSTIYDWRTVFIIVGAPGLLVALLVFLSVREPARGHADGLVDNNETGFSWELIGTSLGQLFQTIRQRRSLLFIILGFSFATFFGYGSLNWLTPFFERSYGMDRGEIGLMLGLVIGIAGAIGTISGGLLADRLGKRDPRWRLWVISIAGLIATPFGAAAYLMNDATLTLLLLAVPITVSVFHAGPAFALLQGLVNVRIRALAAAFLLFSVNFIGGSGGPAYIGLLSDTLAPTYGVESLRWALFTMFIPALLSALFFFLASRTLSADLESAEAEQA